MKIMIFQRPVSLWGLGFCDLVRKKLLLIVTFLLTSIKFYVPDIELDNLDTLFLVLK